MKINPGERVLWVDLLSFDSLYKIYRNRRVVDKVVYLNMYAPFKFFINFFSLKVIGIPIMQLDFVVESDERMEGVSLYEYIQSSLIENLDNLAKYRRISEAAKVFSNNNNDAGKTEKQHKNGGLHPKINPNLVILE